MYLTKDDILSFCIVTSVTSIFITNQSIQKTKLTKLSFVKNCDTTTKSYVTTFAPFCIDPFDPMVMEHPIETDVLLHELMSYRG